MAGWGGVPARRWSSGKLLQVLDVDRRAELQSSNRSSPDGLLSERMPESSLAEQEALRLLPNSPGETKHGVMLGQDETKARLDAVSDPVLFSRFRLTGGGGGSSLGIISLTLCGKEETGNYRLNGFQSF